MGEVTDVAWWEMGSMRQGVSGMELRMCSSGGRVAISWHLFGWEMGWARESVCKKMERRRWRESEGGRKRGRSTRKGRERERERKYLCVFGVREQWVVRTGHHPPLRALCVGEEGQGK